MILSEILVETKVVRIDLSGTDLLVLANPSPEALLEKFKQWGGARGLLIGSHVYWWNDHLAVHNRVAKELNPDWPAGSGRFHLYLYPSKGGKAELQIPVAEVSEASANYYLKRLINDGRVVLKAY